MNRRDLLRLAATGIAPALVRNAAGALIAPRFLDCVMAIGYRPLVIERKHDGKFELKRGDFNPKASGFLYGEFIEKVNETKGGYQVYLVTNTHVLKDIERAELEQIRRFKNQKVEAPKAFASFNPLGEGPATDDWTLPLRDKDGAPGYIAHHDADVAVVAIDTGVLDKAKMTYRFFRSNLDVADRDKANELGFSEGDGIYILGFPMNLVGEGRNYVIAREGSIARIRDALAGTMNEFLVDALVFPGNSGGPVILRPEFTSIKGTASQKRSYLIGMVKSYIPYQDVAISRQTKRVRIIFEENSGLASVIPMDFVKELIKKDMERRRASP